MRAELGRGSRSVVFVWHALTIDGHAVLVYIYDGKLQISSDTYSKKFARGYWDQLVYKGYHVVPEKDRIMRP